MPHVPGHNDPNLLSRILGWEVPGADRMQYGGWRNTRAGGPLDFLSRALIPGAETARMAQGGDASTMGLLGSTALDFLPVGGLLGGAFRGLRGAGRSMFGGAQLPDMGAPGGWNYMSPINRIGAERLEATPMMRYKDRDIVGVRQGGGDMQPFYRSTGRNSDQTYNELMAAFNRQYPDLDIMPRGSAARNQADQLKGAIEGTRMGGRWMPFEGIGESGRWFSKPYSDIKYALSPQSLESAISGFSDMPGAPSWLQRTTGGNLSPQGVQMAKMLRIDPTDQSMFYDATVGRYGSPENMRLANLLNKNAALNWGDPVTYGPHGRPGDAILATRGKEMPWQAINKNLGLTSDPRRQYQQRLRDVQTPISRFMDEQEAYGNRGIVGKLSYGWPMSPLITRGATIPDTVDTPTPTTSTTTRTPAELTPRNYNPPRFQDEPQGVNGSEGTFRRQRGTPNPKFDRPVDMATARKKRDEDWYTPGS